jgi:hypothetical protein
MQQVINGKDLTQTYWSLAEYAGHSDKHAGRARDRVDTGKRSEWCGVESFDEALKLARFGWQEQLPETLAIAESAVATADKEQLMDSFSEPVWDVTGAQVDVGAYLAGTPECMIDYPLSEVSKVGRVITLVVSGVVSGSIEASTIIRRGQVIVALALALNLLGHAVEIWADMSLESSPYGDNDVTAYQRILVKGASDELDAAQIMFGLAHPAMLRVMAFGTWDGFPGTWQEEFSESPSRGLPARRPETAIASFPGGTIFLPEIKSDRDVPNADEFLRKYLGELGLLAE